MDVGKLCNHLTEVNELLELLQAQFLEILKMARDEVQEETIWHDPDQMTFDFFKRQEEAS